MDIRSTGHPEALALPFDALDDALPGPELPGAGPRPADVELPGAAAAFVFDRFEPPAFDADLLDGAAELADELAPPELLLAPADELELLADALALLAAELAPPLALPLPPSLEPAAELPLALAALDRPRTPLRALPPLSLQAELLVPLLDGARPSPITLCIMALALRLFANVRTSLVSMVMLTNVSMTVTMTGVCPLRS